jgi:replicative DNA helicase
VGRGFNPHTGRGITRSRLAGYAAVLADPQLEFAASPDLYWDEVVAIQSIGDRRVYDFNVPDGANFIANDVCVHNSALALNFAENAAIPTGKFSRVPVAVFSLEMSKEQLAQRLLCSQGGISLHRVRSGRLTNEDWPRLTTAAGLLNDAPILIDDSPSPSLMEIRAKCRRLRAENKLGLLVIDYLQLIRGSGRAENRVQEISQITRGLKSLAKELNVPIIALSQLSRAVETRDKTGRPQLSDLRESGSIEQDSDLVLFVYREIMYNKDAEEPNKAELIIAKQRNGPTGAVKLTFLRESTKFVPYSPTFAGETQPEF